MRKDQHMLIIVKAELCAWEFIILIALLLYVFKIFHNKSFLKNRQEIRMADRYFKVYFQM